MNNKRGVFWGLFLMLLGMSSTAFATDLFTPVAGDKSIAVLSQIFGGLLDSGGGDPLLAGIKTLNGAVLIIGGLLASYTIFRSILSTAHEGEMLGKAFSSVWVPIRYSVGTALVLPVIGGGYCVMQAIVMWVIVQGIGLADMVWSSFISQDNLGKTLSASLTRPEAVQSSFKLYESLVCQNFLSAMANTEEGKLFKLGDLKPGVTRETGDFGTKISFGLQAGNKNECGTVTLKAFTAPTAPTSTLNIISFSLKATEAVQTMIVLNKDNVVQYDSLITKLDALSKTEVAAAINGGTPPSLSEVRKAANAYEEALKTSANALVGQLAGNGELSKSASQDGFILAGAYYMKFSEISSKIQSTIADVPVATGPGSFNNSAWQDQYVQMMGKLVSRYEQASVASSTFGVGNQPGGSNQSWWSAIKDSVINFEPSIIIKKAFTSTSSFVLNDGENLILGMKREGNWVLGVASAAQITLMTTNATIGVTPGIATSLGGLVSQFISPMMIVGGVLSYWLPMMPFFIWIGAILGFLVSCVMAIVAAPLWAIAHLHPEGHDVTGKGGQGYMMVLSLLLRPVLMVFGMISGIVLVSVMGDLVNRVFGDVFVLSQVDSGFLIFIVGALIADPLLHGAISFMIIKKCFSLITYLPDEALRWIGGGESFGHFANDESGFTAIKAAAGATALSSGNSGSGGSALGGGKGFKSNEDMKQERMSGMKSNIANTGAKEAQQQAQDKGESFSKMNAEQTQSDFAQRTNEAVDALGGEGSQHAENFLSRVNDAKARDSSRPISNIMNSALNGELNQKYGSGAGGAIGQMGGGYSGEKFQEAASTFEKASESLYNSGLNQTEIKSAISSSVVSANNDFGQHTAACKADPSIEAKGYGEFVKDNLDKTVKHHSYQASL